MKKVILSRILLILIIPQLLVLTVYAHPGRTDYKGGHTDHSTGEYHYHHGYSAHSHEDLDGDGVLDCPYDFVDKTAHSSGSSNQSNSNYQKSKTNNNFNSNTIKEESQVPQWVYWVFGGLSLTIICLLLSIKSKNTIMEEMKNAHKIELDSVKRSCAKQISDKNASIEELNSLRDNITAAKAEVDYLKKKIECKNAEIMRIRQLRCWAKNAPLDISFTKKGMPVYWKSNVYKPFGDYTVFVSAKGDLYHVDPICAGHTANKMHIFEVIEKLRPCKKCAKGFYTFSTVPDWYTAEDNLEGTQTST